jgi:DNA-binding FrmR family transcriptional regulator
VRADHTKVKRLLNTAKGQIEGIVAMIDADRYCVDVSTQILAAVAVLKKANMTVLRAHLDGCVAEALTPDAQTKITEIVDLMEKLG